MIGEDKVITLTSGMIVSIPVRPSSFRCRNKGCKAIDLIWARTQNGRAMPVHYVEGVGWICHFSDCPGAKRFRKKKKPLIIKKGGKNAK